MDPKKLAFVALGVLVAAVLVYFVAFHEPEGVPPAETPKESAPERGPKPKPNEPAPVATAQSPSAAPSARQTTGKATAALTGGVEGTVTNPDGQPMAGVRVELVKPISQSPFAMALQGGPKAPKPEPKVFSTNTGSDGKFRLSAPADSWTLTATHPDYRREELLNVVTVENLFLSFPIQLRPGIRLFGRVTEEEKNLPIVGAVVVLDDAPVTPGFAVSTQERRETTTDSSGQFRFENLRPGRHSLSIRATTYGTKDFPIINVPEEPTYRYDVRLARGQNISGRVVDPNGNPVGKALVVATTAGLGTSHGQAMSNELGEFVVVDVDEGRYFLTADAGDLGQGRTDPAQPIASGSVGVEVKLAARSGAQGIVKDKVSGQPIANFTIEVRRAAPNAKAFPRAGGPYSFSNRKDGSFDVGGVDPAGEFVLLVSAEGFAPNYSERFSVQPGQITRGVNVVLAPGGTVTGRIVDTRTSQPVAGASVRTRDNDWNDLTGVPVFGALIGDMPQRTADMTVSTDSDGRFEIRNVPEGTIQLHVTHPAYVATQQRDVTVSDGVKTELGVLRMSTGCGVKGTVYGADGAPAANAEVRIQSKPSLSGGTVRSFASKTVRCDAQGKYVIRNLAAGDYMIHALPMNTDNGLLKIALSKRSQKDVTLIDGADQDVDLFITN